MTVPAPAEAIRTHAQEPRLAFDGNPNLIPVCIPEALSGYTDVAVENISARHPQFQELAGAYISHLLHRDSLMGSSFVWPPFKLSALTNVPDEELFEADGTPDPSIVQAVIERYIKPTIRDKGNHLVVMHGNVNGEPGFIGGGLSFAGVVSENEGWISKGIVAPETNGVANRGNGLGRVLQEGRIMHWMLAHPDKSNLNTGVNIEPDGISAERHVVTSRILRDMDVMQQLKQGEIITLQSVQQQYAALLNLLDLESFAHQAEVDPEKLSQFYMEVDAIAGPEGFSGFTFDSMIKRKDIIVAMAKLLEVPLTPTERTFLRCGGEYLNAIPDSARVKTRPDTWVHTRRLMLRRENWQALMREGDPQVAGFLDEQLAA